MARRTDLTPMPLFDAHGSPSSLGQRWKQWLTKFQTYVTASGITDDTQKRVMLLYLAGSAVQDIFETLSDTQVKQKILRLHLRNLLSTSLQRKMRRMKCMYFAKLDNMRKKHSHSLKQDFAS